MTGAILKKIVSYSRKTHGKLDKIHDFSHVNMVLKIAVYICKKENGDLDVIRAGALLHDIGQIEGEEAHAVRGARLSRDLLESLQLDERFIEKVVLCVKNHSRSAIKKRKTLEEKIIHDADKMTTLGVLGLTRGIVYYLNKGCVFDVAVNKSLEFQKETVSDYLQTKTAKVIGKRLLRYSEKFVEEFRKENLLKYLK